MFPHSRHLLITFILAVIQLTQAIPDSNFNPDNSPPIQANLAPPPKSDPASSSTSALEPTRRLFTVAAFRSPYAPGQISGTVMRAEGGIFWLDPLNPLPDTGCGDSSKQGDCPPETRRFCGLITLGRRGWLVALSRHVPDSCVIFSLWG
jgi:hypothetical protein